ncbi:ZYRO0D10010p [Zygosaccharomyces rouxii]|uniref:ZYRO0D10010p n=1 Tax=Zygosaccharomyces rouxii (strain ATCC 2623 / CBS 732 / NBRC 1130 / NCYC 568 / NRRL Y-229) TaxID=559307 RepID=C5DVW7_ZYGRC|nr:uncharacterized protein ZYRO0D10010g [Zygosaccharomyces rouxii]KAH9200846.1 BAR domain-containing family protein [Zygosaccharomyces rouxii]CAR27936.1 ZYRO0D10010p [Zygosaccharomyces rouxii]
MSEYFSSFSFKNLGDSIANAAHRTQDKLSNAVANVNLNDPQTRLSIKTRTRYLKETLGAVDEISKLPPQYVLLERKSDALEKACKRMLLVTQTFEVEGYDYPPNLPESFSDWWSGSKEGWFGSTKQDEDGESKIQTDGSSKDPLMPRSFAQAIAKASHECGEAYQNSQKSEKKQIDEDEDDVNLVEMFNTLSICYRNIDEGKDEMDKSIAREFNDKLEQLLNRDFKKIHVLRNKVENSRLKFDTMRYEMRLKEKEEKEENENTANADEGPSNKNQQEPTNEPAKEEEKPTPAEPAEAQHTTKTENSNKEPMVEKPEDNKLLEQLEDEFVSNTSEAVETMTSIVEGSEILRLMKLFQNLQLVYYRQCVQEMEASLKGLNDLEN